MENFSTLYKSNKTLFSSVPSWVKNIKEASFKKSQTSGLPTRKDEEWKYTNVSSLAKKEYKTAEKIQPLTQSEEKVLAKLAGNKLVFVNGVYSKEHSTINTSKGVEVLQLNEAFDTHPELLASMVKAGDAILDNSLIQLNQSLMGAGVLIHIKDKKTPSELIHLVYFNQKTSHSLAIFPRHFIRLEKHSEAKIMEHYIGNEGEYFNNSLTDISLAGNSKLMFYSVQSDSKAAQHISHIRADVAKDATLETFSLSTGSKLARHGLDIALNGPNSHAIFNGFYLTQGTNHIDHHTNVDHKHPHCKSNQYYKGILKDSSRGVFNGKVFVRKDAQKTDATQLNKNLLLSSDAEIDTKPQLEIDADDVKCAHGASISQLGANQLYYFQTRCISKSEAYGMLCEAFAKDVLSGVSDESSKKYLSSLITESLQGVSYNE